ncbi:MAG: AAA family ATPase [Nanoarchaeota archaeon]|nr:AAA family ATPase [Nanoarchaeota archaeon]
MTSKDKEVESVVYNYTTQTNQMEEENRVLRETVQELRNEVERFKTPPLMVCEVREIFKDHVIIRVPNGNRFYVNLSRNSGKLTVGDQVLVEQRNLTVIKRLSISKRFDVEKFVIMEKPKVSWKDVGGLKDQIIEVQEVIELPLMKPELFEKVGIQPPKGILLHGEPGTGKTLLAKAVAASTKSTFIEIVGSELVQKFIGEGAKLVKEIFILAKEKAPSIIFIDELDAIAAKRIEIGTSGEREVQRTFMQLLAEIDGFKHLADVKVIGCTNRRDILDPAMLRPGRLDRQIHIPLPTKEGIEQIFRIHTKRMRLNKKMNIKRLVMKMDGFSGAEIRAVATEAGYFAIRKNRNTVNEKDLIEAIAKVKEKEKEDHLLMFG